MLAGNPQGVSYLDDGPKMLSMYIGDEDLMEIIGPREVVDEKASEKGQLQDEISDCQCQD